VTNLQLIKNFVRTLTPSTMSEGLLFLDKELERTVKAYVLPHSLSTSILYRLRNASEPV
jgi:hypothetical protein